MEKNWRWIVLAAAFLSTVANSTIFLAFGAFVLPWMNEFSASAAAIAAVTSCGSSISSMACPIGSFVVQKLGYRATHVVGGAMLMASFAMSSFAQSLTTMFFTYSILGGLGSSLCMISFVNAVSEHFQKNQALAFAVVTSAYGVGGFIFPLYFEKLIEIYTWRGAVLITSAVFGNIIVCGLLLHTPASAPRLPTFCSKVQRKASLDVIVAYREASSSDSTEKGEGDVLDVRESSIGDKISLDESSVEIKTSVSVCVAIFGICERKRATILDENFNVTKVDSKDVFEEESTPENSREKSFVSVTLDLLTSSSFYIFLLHNISTYMGFFLVFGLTPIRASYDLQLSDQQAFALVSTSGIANCVCRILYGAIVQFKWVKASTMYLCSFFLGGTLAPLSLMADTYLLQILYCLINAACFANVTFYNTLVFRIYDRKLFNVAYGYLEMLHGIGIVTGPIIGGVIFDITGSCDFSFVFAGLAILFGTLILPMGLTLTGQIRKLDF